MLKITIEFFELNKDFEPDYFKRQLKVFYGENAQDCMNEYHNFTYYHDLAKYTATRIINVEEE